MRIDHRVADFWMMHNNNVLAIRPNPDGRFAQMVQQEEGCENQKAWVFKNPMVYHGEVSQIDLDIFHGNLDQLEELLEWMRSNQMTWTSHGGQGSSFVPCSNGYNSYLDYSDTVGYAKHEHDAVRKDSPRMAIEAYLKVIS